MPAEREFVVNIMMLASADQQDRHGIFWQLDQAAKYLPINFHFSFFISYFLLHQECFPFYDSKQLA